MDKMPNTPKTPKWKIKKGGPSKQERRQKHDFLWEPKEHHCASCERPTSHPKTRTAFLQEHSEVCVNFHHSLHWKGKASECAACITAEEAQYQRHKEIAEIVADLNKDGSQTRSKKASKIPVVAVPGTDIGRVANAMINTFYKSSINALHAADDLVEANFKQLGARPRKNPTREDGELFPDIHRMSDNKTLKRHARICAAFGLGLNDKSGNAKAHAALLERFWETVKDAKITYENEQNELHKRREGFKAWAGSTWEAALPR